MVDKSTLDRCLDGISFPADKEEIAECAMGNTCPSDALTQIHDLRVSTFHSEDELLCHLGDVSFC